MHQISHLLHSISYNGHYWNNPSCFRRPCKIVSKVFHRMQLSRIVAIFLMLFAVNAWQIRVKNSGKDFELLFGVEWTPREETTKYDPKFSSSCDPRSFEYTRKGQRSCWIKNFSYEDIEMNDNMYEIKVKVWLRWLYEPESIVDKVFDEFYSDRFKCLEFENSRKDPKWKSC